MLRASLMPREVVGRKVLEMLADELFDKSDPTVTYSKESPMKIYEENGTSILALKLPFATDQKVELYTRRDDLTLHVGAFKKSITLPHTMANKKVLGAELENGWLRIRFEGEEIGERKGRKGRRGRKASRKAS